MSENRPVTEPAPVPTFDPATVPPAAASDAAPEPTLLDRLTALESKVETGAVAAGGAAAHVETFLKHLYETAAPQPPDAPEGQPQPQREDLATVAEDAGKMVGELVTVGRQAAKGGHTLSSMLGFVARQLLGISWHA